MQSWKVMGLIVDEDSMGASGPMGAIIDVLHDVLQGASTPPFHLGESLSFILITPNR